MGQREAGRPSSYNRQAKPTANRLQEKIRAIVRKAVATWQHPQAGRPRGGSPAPLVSPVIRAGPDRQVQSVESGTEDSVSSVHVKRSVCKRTEEYPVESAVFTENRTVFIQLNQRKLAMGLNPACFVSTQRSYHCTTLCLMLYA